ncbi:MAG: hypothetical protein DSY42_05985 [Aquifex sp.]|nr:MAG: hypothetical protein DSY42_05985 [Aquifex sp.]
MVFRDGENYKEEITEKNIGRKYFPSDVDEEEAIKLLKQGEKVEAYEYDERELCNCARKAFEILRQKTEENPEVIENLGVVVYEDGKVEYRIFEETPYVLEENLDEISKPIEKPPKGIPRFGFCEKALLWRFER